MYVYGDTLFKNLLLQNHKSDDLETWHTAKGLEPYNNYINDDPGLSLTYLTTKSNLFISAFTLENLENNHNIRRSKFTEIDSNLSRRYWGDL